MGTQRVLRFCNLKIPPGYRNAGSSIRWRFLENVSAIARGVPQLSVVIPTFNSGTQLMELLDALRGATPFPFEVIVSDNGSSDGTREVASTYDGGFEVRVIDSSLHKSTGYARRVGASAARADKLIFIDHDDVPGASYLEAMKRALDRYPFVFSEVETKRLNPSWLHDITSGPGTGTVKTGGWEFVWGGTIGIDKALYDRCDGFSSDMTLDDAAFCFNVFLVSGVVPKHAGGALLHYRFRTTAKAVFKQRKRYGETQALTNHLFRPLGYDVEIERAVIARLLWHSVRSVPSWRNRSQRYVNAADLGLLVGRVEGNLKQIAKVWSTPLRCDSSVGYEAANER